MNQQDVVRRIERFLKQFDRQHRAAVLSTVDSSGRPHSVWMGTLASPSYRQLLTLTSPDSRKLINILHNPEVEWMLTNDSMEAVLYFRGRARVVEDPAQAEAAWRELPDKSRAWFLNYQEKLGMSFMIVETNVREIEYREPERNFARILSCEAFEMTVP